MTSFIQLKKNVLKYSVNILACTFFNLKIFLQQGEKN